MKLSKILSPIAMVIAFSGTATVLTGCNEKQPEAGKEQVTTVNVQVFKVEPLDFTLKTVLPGRVLASRTAEIRPQVSGIILKREFTESSDVTAGQSLYQIDPAIYQATYDSALASLESAKAKANISALTVKRYEGLLSSRSISRQDYDTAVADAKQADAQVAIAQANVNTAKVNLDYTKVYSPIDGYIGKSSVTEGALVSAGQTSDLALVQQLDPIYVDMTESVIKYEQNLQNQGKLFTPPTDNNVEIFYSDGSKFDQNGYIQFSDKTVSETTGTVTLRAVFKNPIEVNEDGSHNRRLLPGMFVKPVLTLGTIKNAVIVPQQGITSDEQGHYTARVVKPDGMIELRSNLQVYQGITGYWIVTEGIKTGEQVVISGLMSLSTVQANVPVKANILGEPTSLTQKQVDDLISQNIK